MYVVGVARGIENQMVWVSLNLAGSCSKPKVWGITLCFREIAVTRLSSNKRRKSIDALEKT